MKAAKSPLKFKKAYAVGGVLDPNDPTQKTAISSANMSSMIGAGASLVGSLADTFDKGNSRGHQSGLTTGLKQGASMAASGAAIGSVIPGVGTIAGGVIGGSIGLASGLIGGAGQASDDRAMDRYDAYKTNNAQVAQGRARVAQDPSLVYGQRGAQVFADGGNLPLPTSDTVIYRRPSLNSLALNANLPLSPTNPLMVDKGNGVIGQWGFAADSVPALRLPKGAMPVLGPSDKAVGRSNQFYPSRSNSVAPTPGIIHRNSYASGGAIHIDPDNKGKFTAWASAHDMGVQEAASHVMANKEDYSGTIVKRANFAKNFGGKKAYGGSIKVDNVETQQVPGGNLKDMNSHSVEVEGKSHEQGGVQLPEAEVEGGETISNGFVFSKSLGFADLHKPIAKALGKLENKPMDPIRRKTMNILQGREQGLMLSQEFLKQRLGIPSDLNT